LIKAWPKAVYIETSVLRKLPIYIASAEFLQLKAFCEFLDVHILTTQLCVDEFNEIHRKDLKGEMSRLRNALIKLEPYFARPLEKASLSDSTAILDEVQKKILADLRKQGIEVLKDKDIAADQNRLKEMAVKKLPPFTEEGEKGFRDGIILFTIIDYEREINRDDLYGLFLTADNAIKSALEVLPECKDLKIIPISSIHDAIEHLKGFLKEAARDVYDFRVKVLLEFLNQNRDKIEMFVREGASFPQDSLHGPELGLFDTVVEIGSIDLINIQNAVPGTLADQAKKGTVRISFEAKVQLALVITRPLFPPTGKLRLKGKERLLDRVDPTVLSQFLQGGPPQQEVSIERAVVIEASAHLEAPNGKDIYSDLALESVSTLENPFSLLLKARHHS